jgi:hypothetical protein
MVTMPDETCVAMTFDAEINIRQVRDTISVEDYDLYSDSYKMKVRKK